MAYFYDMEHIGEYNKENKYLQNVQYPPIIDQEKIKKIADLDWNIDLKQNKETERK